MKITFRYGKADGRVWAVTFTTLFVVGGVIAALWLLAGGAYYVAAWSTAVAVAIGLLFLLSKPTRIILTDNLLELRCLVDTTYIKVGSIVDVAVVGEAGLKRKFPLCGSWGFWGYFGRYIDFGSWRTYRVYASNRHKCLAIHTTRRRYLISCHNAELLRDLILDTRARTATE